MRVFLTDTGSVYIQNHLQNILYKKWWFDKTNVSSQLERWKSCIPWIQPYYALKSNPSPELIEALTTDDTFPVGLDVASISEYNIACKYSNLILYTNPHMHIKDTDVRCNTLTVIDDISVLERIHCTSILIRMNSCVETSNCKFDGKFGCTQEEAYNIIDKAKYKNIKVIGISFHIGSGGTHNRKEAYLKAYTYAEPILHYLKSIYNETPILDIGGGLLSNSDLTDILEWTKPLPYKIIAEPGRYFSEPSFHLVTSVISRTNRGIFLDNGVYHELNVFHRDHWKFPLLVYCYDTETNEMNTVTEYEDIQLFGPTCDSYDTIGICKVPRDLHPNDLIFLEHMGAYT
uniref:Orn/DAP/Arg decarboxylase 2 N-terminal domain-containing protein n=1 Tax=viral metagenome TaxID=1070528 RepID=A0A6C0JUQ7_9ZZZZ